MHTENILTGPQSHQERVNTVACTQDAQCQTVCEAGAQTDSIEVQKRSQSQFHEMNASSTTDVSIDFSNSRSECEKSKGQKKVKSSLYESSDNHKKGRCTAHADKCKYDLKGQGHWHANLCKSRYLSEGKKKGRKKRAHLKKKTGAIRKECLKGCYNRGTGPKCIYWIAHSLRSARKR